MANLKFKIKDVTVNTVGVEYEDGSVATVPITKGMNQEQIYDVVKAYNYKFDEFEKQSDVPVTASEDWIQLTPEEERKFTYKEARQFAAPQLWEVVYADYLARKGDTSYQVKIDEKIDALLAAFPKDDKTYTLEEIRKWDES
tara:strand:+ start:2159 stop:2584 length:426 start_codon:yes stop_codon:yes gene_type:complete